MIDPSRETMNAREIARFQFRSELFQQHGWPVERADAWADTLVLRDRSGDERRLCVECKHLLSDWRCAKREAVFAEVLQRCPAFKWQVPTK